LSFVAVAAAVEAEFVAVAKEAVLAEEAFAVAAPAVVVGSELAIEA